MCLSLTVLALQTLKRNRLATHKIDSTSRVCVHVRELVWTRKKDLLPATKDTDIDVMLSY